MSVRLGLVPNMSQTTLSKAVVSTCGDDFSFSLLVPSASASAP